MVNWVTGGLPIPPGDLVSQVTGTDDVGWFLESGRLSAESLQDVLQKNRLDIQKFESILDFGCGVGRVMRYWRKLRGPSLFGTDYNPDLVAWCRENLRFARFEINPLTGPLSYQDEKFDFIYTLSVFTHLTEEQQFLWIDELKRVLKPGGSLLISVHGEKFYIPQILPEDQERFQRGELVVYGEEHEGTNMCTAFHPEAYVRYQLAKGMKILDFVPEGALGNPRQDLYLLKKPASPR